MNELLTETELSVRKDFSKIPSILEIPDLIEIQKQTFERFLQTDVEPEKRENTGLQAVFSSVFPIKEGVSKDEAKKIKEQVEAAGGQVDVK